MPRKVSYGVDYDEGDYDDGYEDYDYEYDEYVDDKGEDEADSKGVTDRASLWRCSICTYDNEDSWTACDVCGVLRQPLDDSKIERNAALNQVSGVSVLARCLFASSPFQVPQNAEKDHQQVDGLMWEGDNNVCQHVNFKGNFNQFHKAFCSFSQSHVEIAPFRFDTPSPDDLVSHGRNSSQNGQKANLQNVKPPRVSSSINNKDNALDAHSNTKKFKNSSLPSAKGKEDANTNSEKSNRSKVGASVIQSSNEAPDNSSFLVQGKDRSLEGSSSSMEGRKPHGHFSSMNNKSLSNKPRNSGGRRAKSLAEYQPDKWMLPDRAEDTLTQLNLAIVGHVDSGKSTLSGRLLYLLGRITQKEMHKNEKEAKIQGKGSFSYAWALDESPEERERGITMTVAVAYFDTKRYHVVVLDSPGHKDFVPNMISGATQADAAILVIDAITGAFEAGMDSTKGQTREHAQLIRSFGVEQIIVAVNKMDGVGYSKDRFDSIKTQLGTFLRSCSFRDSSISWVPLSVMENQNLVAGASDPRLSSWFQGPHLLDAIDSIQPPSRDFSKPLLMPICDVVRSSMGQVLASGKLETGALRSGLKVLLMPSGDIGMVRSLERDSKPCTIARAGDSVAVGLSGIDVNNVLAGGVICHPDFPVSVVKRLEVKVLVLELKIPILVGSQLEFHLHHAKEAATVAKIVSLLDSKTGKVTKKTPRCITSKQSAVIEVVLQGPVCVDEFSNSRALGRAFLRALGRTIAVGVVTKVIDDEE